MKLTVLLLTVAFLQVNANGYSQTITYSGKNVPLEKIFTVIKEQAGFGFIYFDEQLEGAKKVTINVKNATVENVLAICMKDQPYDYTIKAKTIFIINRQKKETADIKVSAEQQKGKRINISGRVTGEQGEPVVGATITVKGTDVATSTNDKGVFYLNDVDEDAVLVVTYISYQVQEVALRGRSSLDVRLKIGGSDLDEAMVVAYNTTTRRMNTGAVSVVKGEQIATLPNRSFDKSLQGLVPGLLVTQGTGQPGGGVANFVVRGIATGADPNTLASARNPLIVMDGVPLFQDQPSITSSNIASSSNPLAQLNPSDIETITVLKDAAAISLYGSKASNGVILVTTKRGKEGKTTVSLRHQTDIAERLKGQQEMLNQEEYLELLSETYRNTDPTLWTDAAILADLKTKFPTKPDGSFYPQTDWLNELYRQSAVTAANQLSLSGGNNRQIFYFNIEYTKQNGVEKKTGFDRKSIRFNYENKPSSWIKLGINSTSSYSTQDVGMGLSELAAMRISPLNPVRNESGDLIYLFQRGAASSADLNTISSYFANPAANQQLNFNRNVSFRGLNRLYAEVKFLNYFTFLPSFGADFMLTESKWKVHPKLSLAYNFPAEQGSIYTDNYRAANLISSNILRFDKTFNKKHALNILVAHEAQVRTNNRLLVSRRNISSNPITEEVLTGTLTGGSGVSAKETLLSYFGQTNYGFLDRYFLSASIRRDGSSLFGENNLFGTHWSAGAGWLLSAEPLLKGTSGWLNYLKIRGSIGSAGNSSAIINTMRYHRLQLIQFQSTAVMSDPNFAPNPGIKWEKTFSWNAGLDLRILNERITASVDLYERKTSGLLGSIDLPWATGYYSLRTNIGDLKNNGLELSLSADIIKTKNFRWNLSGNWSTNKNRLIKSAYPLETSNGSPDVSSSSITVNGEGENYNSFYLNHWAGVDATTGKPQWIDSTGKYSSDWYGAKPQFVGKPQPDGFGSFSQTLSWKYLTLTMLFNYQYGFQVYVDPESNPLVNDGIDPFLNQGKAALNRWQKPGDIASNPRRLLFGSINGISDDATLPSTRYLQDGDFIRLSYITLTYQLPKKLLNRLRVIGANIYVQGNNLATWTKYSGRQDPENISATGRAFSIYPLQRSYSVGINLNF